MSNNETLADILAEMRRHIQAVRNYPQDIDITDGDVEDWADRIEAAYARDIGNSAALREALVKTLDAFKSGAIRTEWNDPDSWKHDDELWYLKNDIESALAAPPRNCDVGTPKEQAERFKAFCLPRVGKCSENSTCPAKHPCNEIGIQYCQLKWAQMPYEAEGGAE